MPLKINIGRFFKHDASIILVGRSESHAPWIFCYLGTASKSRAASCLAAGDTCSRRRVGTEASCSKKTIDISTHPVVCGSPLFPKEPKVIALQSVVLQVLLCILYRAVPPWLHTGLRLNSLLLYTYIKTFASSRRSAAKGFMQC